MGWRDRLLRLMARGRLAPPGERPLDTRITVRVLDRIEGDPALSDRLDALDAEALRAAFLALYREEEEAG